MNPAWWWWAWAAGVVILGAFIGYCWGTIHGGRKWQRWARMITAANAVESREAARQAQADGLRVGIADVKPDRVQVSLNLVRAVAPLVREFKEAEAAAKEREGL